MDAPGRNVASLERMKLSRATRDALFASDAEKGAFGPSVTLRTFLKKVGETASPETAAQIVAARLGARLAAKSDPTPSEPGGPETQVSPALVQAFEEAAGLRKRTGGKDDWIGIRHVLFEILTSTRDPLAFERRDLFAAIGADEDDLAYRISRYCWNNREPQENEGEWRQLFDDRGVDPFGSPPGKSGVARLESDDPWSGSTADRVNATAEARAFAATVVSDQFRPPLAVGIFGDWGSGKSFFMRLLHEAVDRQQAMAPADPVEGGVGFLGHVVQVRFNAWHYADTNLWASLIDHIFTCLDRWAETHNAASRANNVFDRLSTARRLTIEAAEALISRREERVAAASALEKATLDRMKREAELASRPETYLQAAWASLVGTGKQREEVRKAGQLLGLGDVTSSASEFKAAATALDRELAGMVAFRSGLIRALAAPLVVVAVVAGMIVTPLVLAWISRATGDVSAVGAAVSGALAPLALGVSWAARRSNDALTKVRGFREQFDLAVAREVEQQRSGEEAARRQLIESESNLLEARKRLENATEMAAQAARDYQAETGKGRVLSFVRDRLSAGDYARQLGFVAMVRKDFEELSRLMTSTPSPDSAAKEKAHRKHVEKLVRDAAKDKLLQEEEISKLRKTLDPPDLEGPVFERIVLYIDDLDRCPTQQVVAVLQAIHLLLAFPLFVVFVAVDVRWLRHALAKEYRGQIAAAPDDSGVVATAGDYLEKIFQIPFWVRSMPPESTEAILEDRMGPDESGLLAGGGAAAAQGGPDPDESAGKASGEARMDPTAEALGEPSRRLRPGERTFIKAMAKVLDGSPRRTLRFINTYRIVKASFGAADLKRFEGGGYRAFATLLAVAVTADDLFPVIARALSGGGTVEDVLTCPEVRSSPCLGAIAEAFRQLSALGGMHSDLSHYCELVGRFSFHSACSDGAVSATPPGTPGRSAGG